MNRRGFTLVETMIAIAIFVLISAGLSSTFMVGRSAWDVSENSTQVQMQARAAMWVMVKDLRQSNGTIDSPTLVNAVSATFSHPVDGTVTYAWTRNATTGVGHITRTTAAATRTIARNISAFTLVPSVDKLSIVVSVTAQGRSVMGRIDAMTLTEKVGVR